MKKSTGRNATRVAAVGLLLAAAAGGVIAIVHAGGLATRPVGELHGRLEITDEGGVQECMVTAKQTYMRATKEGTAHVAVRRDGARVASASARLKADTQEQAAAAVSALVLYLTGRQARPGMQCQDIDEGDGRGLQCSDIKTDGNVRILLEHADKIIGWWDAQASLTYDDYVSPVPAPPSGATLYTPPLTASNPGEELRCRAVNVSSQPLTITAELIDGGTGQVVESQTCQADPGAESCAASHTQLSLGYCRFTVEGGGKDSVRAALMHVCCPPTSAPRAALAAH